MDEVLMRSGRVVNVGVAGRTPTRKKLIPSRADTLEEAKLALMSGHPRTSEEQLQADKATRATQICRLQRKVAMLGLDARIAEVAEAQAAQAVRHATQRMVLLNAWLYRLYGTQAIQRRVEAMLSARTSTCVRGRSAEGENVDVRAMLPIKELHRRARAPMGY